MILMPASTASIRSPKSPTLILVCDIIEPSTMQGYERDPRNIAKRAEEYLKSTGIGDTVFVGPEPEFFIFDDEVKFKSDISGSMFKSSPSRLPGTPTPTSSPATRAIARA
ncbi:glutamine synthetase [Pseudomonas aeruginosa]|nr:glutamine synthetase [Pseudomonas aeruginosa]